MESRPGMILRDTAEKRQPEPMCRSVKNLKSAVQTIMAGGAEAGYPERT
jgi:hypothetical protein